VARYQDRGFNGIQYHASSFPMFPLNPKKKMNCPVMLDHKMGMCTSIHMYSPLDRGKRDAVYG
jgi:hypothetical protein